MRNLPVAAFLCLTTTGVADAGTIVTPDVVVTFEETDTGLRASFTASIDLAGLTPRGSAGPLTSRFFGIGGFGMQLTSASSAESVDEFGTRGSFDFAFNVFGDEFFDSTNVINETGDTFGFGVIGSDIPFLVYSLPPGYVSKSPLSGSATFVDLSLPDVSPLLGTFPLDFDNSRSVMFRAIAVPELSTTTVSLLGAMATLIRRPWRRQITA